MDNRRDVAVSNFALGCVLCTVGDDCHIGLPYVPVLFSLQK